MKIRARLSAAELAQFTAFTDEIAKRAAAVVDAQPGAAALTDEEWAARVTEISTAGVMDYIRRVARRDPGMAERIKRYIHAADLTHQEQHGGR